jgi:large subunit ribosomal protein L6
MSRIGRLPVPLTTGVKIAVDGRKVSVQGPKGSLSQELPGGITAEVADGKLVVKRRDDSKPQRALHGLSRALIANAVEGVTKGFSKDLEIQGVGYRAQLAGKSSTSRWATRTPSISRSPTASRSSWTSKPN